jgi:hypothetical protein
MTFFKQHLIQNPMQLLPCIYFDGIYSVFMDINNIGVEKPDVNGILLNN